MLAWYNEIDDYAAEWLENLITAGHLPPGKVDRRPIQEVNADEIRGYTQCHFFAGIGGWPLALRLAGWPDDRPVWTGSCPCQPFSSAGKQSRQQDERHLWPYWGRLIEESVPPTIFGEQVASAIAAGWWDDVATRLETAGYAVAATVLPACSVGLPHRRDRLWFVANAAGARSFPSAYPGIYCGEEGTGTRDVESQRFSDVADSAQQPERESANEPHTIPACGETWPQFSYGSNSNGIVGDPILTRLEGYAGNVEKAGGGRHRFDQLPRQIPLADTPSERPSGSGQLEQSVHSEACYEGQADQFVDDSEWVDCPDGKTRPVKPGICLLANGVPARVGRLRAYGNAIVPQVAAEFIRASMLT